MAGDKALAGSCIHHCQRTEASDALWSQSFAHQFIRRMCSCQFFIEITIPQELGLKGLFQLIILNMQIFSIASAWQFQFQLFLYVHIPILKQKAQRRRVLLLGSNCPKHIIFHSPENIQVGKTAEKEGINSGAHIRSSCGVTGNGSTEYNPLGTPQAVTEIGRYFAFRACAEKQAKALWGNKEFFFSRASRKGGEVTCLTHPQTAGQLQFEAAIIASSLLEPGNRREKDCWKFDSKYSWATKIHRGVWQTWPKHCKWDIFWRKSQLATLCPDRDKWEKCIRQIASLLPHGENPQLCPCMGKKHSSILLWAGTLWWNELSPQWLERVDFLVHISQFIWKTILPPRDKHRLN